ncbi:MAG: triphosphoribosyl-dephospho-CoA synthase [Methylococcaceae bacterium]|nr:triphosphoribosyl-dephospho-CoA synthase [Methylococcaceae bacterium]
MLNREQMIDAYKKACICDVEAFKPGNVSVYNAGHDMSVADFLLSAEVSAEPITNPDYSLGEKIFHAVKATRDAVGCNTNLGILLLCAPVIQAGQQVEERQSLLEALRYVLENTSIKDADWVFKAISLASPGGLGESADQDVSERANVTLFQAMEIAQNKDRIAKQYVTYYKDIFNFSILRYNDGLNRFGNQEWAAVFVFTGLLSKFPDSHIERKYGNEHSGWVLKKIIAVDDALINTQDPEQLVPMLHEVDREFKEKGINPGTTADLTVATVFVVMMEAFSVRCTR